MGTADSMSTCQNAQSRLSMLQLLLVQLLSIICLSWTHFHLESSHFANKAQVHLAKTPPQLKQPHKKGFCTLTMWLLALVRCMTSC